MSAIATGAIGPVSVRYAAQIRELLFAQALQRMAADQQAARAASGRAEAEQTRQQPDDRTQSPEPAPAKSAEPAHEGKTPGAMAARLVDIQA